MKLALVTICIGEEFQKIAELTHPILREYAEKIGADFIVIDEPKHEVPHYEIFQLYDLLTSYNRILYIDTDCLVREDCPNLFDVVPADKIGMFDEGQFVDRTQAMSLACQNYKMDIDEWKREYYNSGVVVVSRRHRFLFSPPEKEFDDASWGREQSLLNLRIAKEKYQMHPLEYSFNRMSIMDDLTGEDRQASYIIHYAGAPTKQEMLRIMEKDIGLWSTGFRGKHHILIKVSGGMGDQINAEPVIRWMRENVYRDADITVSSDWPRIFKHLDGQWVNRNVHHNQFSPEVDVPYYLTNTLPNPDTFIWQVVSHALCHGVDFASICMLRRTIPDKAKQYKLEVGIDDIQQVVSTIGMRPLDKMILIHAGRHWPSKTFPADWWDEVISGVAASGIQVVLIGKDVSDDQGYVSLADHEGVIDARDLLDQGALFGIVSQARVLITNDSAPLHIAGAFDNHIVLIPTVKHPDHILPYRNGDKYYKAAALYKKLTCDAYDSSPTMVHGQTLENVIGDIRDYLPDPADVIDTAVRIYNSEG